MTRKILCLAILLLSFRLDVSASDESGNIGVRNVNITAENSQVSVSMDLLLDSVRLKRNGRLFVTPYLEDETGLHTLMLPTVLVNGRNMQYVYLRSGLSAQESRTYININKVVERRNGTAQQVKYAVVSESSPWIRRGKTLLRLSVDTCGCGMKMGGGQSSPLATLDMNPAPRMRLAFITPPVTEQPVLAHEGKARVQFEVDSITLHAQPYVCRNGQRIDNRDQLRIIDDSISYALSDPNVEIAAISICGYASPESPYSHNDYLATNRSRSLSEYIARRYSLPQERCTYSAVPENWEDFRQMTLEADDITETQRMALLELIDVPVYGPADYDAKEARLKSGKAFASLYRKKILPEWFPLLRCTKFVINTRLRPLPDTQLAEIIKTNPRMMTLNQMFRVARLYPEGSAQFNETIETALRFYADDPVANTNAAVAAIKAGSLEKAEQFLLKAGSLPEAENARGVIAAYKGDYEKALFHFAAAGTLPEAQKNKSMLE